MITKEQYIEAVQHSKNISDVCRYLGKNPYYGGIHQFVSKKIKEFGISTEHFDRYYNNSVCRTERNYVTSEKYKQNRCAKSSVLLRKLIKEGIKEEKCEMCGNKEWLGNKIPLELHHIDGNHFNNDNSNLMVLCPNCHATTDSYCGKKIKKHYYCKKCGHEITKYSKTGLCLNCIHETQKRCVWPTKEELINLLKENSNVSIAKMYGVSDKTVAKWIKKYEI